MKNLYTHKLLQNKKKEAIRSHEIILKILINEFLILAKTFKVTLIILNKIINSKLKTNKILNLLTSPTNFTPKFAGKTQA